MASQQNAGVPLASSPPVHGGAPANFVYAEYPTYPPALAQSGSYGPPLVPASLQRKASILKALCVFELLLTLWFLILGGGYLVFIIFIPMDIIGFLGAHNYRRQTLVAYVVLKVVILGLFFFEFGHLIAQWSCPGCGSNGEVPILTSIMLIFLLFQVICIVLAVKMRKEIWEWELLTNESHELSAFSDEPAPHMEAPYPGSGAQVPYPVQQQQPPQFAYSPYPQYAPYPQMTGEYGAQQMAMPMPYPPYPQQSSGPYPPPAHAMPSYPAFTPGNPEEERAANDSDVHVDTATLLHGSGGQRHFESV